MKPASVIEQTSPVMGGCDDGPFDWRLYSTMTRKFRQQVLIAPDVTESWQHHWRGMPEFVQMKQTEYAKITVRFRDQESLDDFCAKIGQKLNPRSQCTWHPELPPIGRSATVKRWVDDAE